MPGPCAPVRQVSILPFDLIGLASNSGGLSQLHIIRVVRLLRMLKLVRVLKVNRQGAVYYHYSHFTLANTSPRTGLSLTSPPLLTLDLRVLLQIDRAVGVSARGQLLIPVSVQVRVWDDGGGSLGKSVYCCSRPGLESGSMLLHASPCFCPCAVCLPLACRRGHRGWGAPRG